jgi:hypothetical protein
MVRSEVAQLVQNTVRWCGVTRVETFLEEKA